MENSFPSLLVATLSHSPAVSFLSTTPFSPGAQAGPLWDSHTVYKSGGSSSRLRPTFADHVVPPSVVSDTKPVLPTQTPNLSSRKQIERSVPATGEAPFSQRPERSPKSTTPRS